MSRSVLSLGKSDLTLEDIWDVAVLYRGVEISKPARERIAKSARFLKKKVDSGKVYYGINTGFGPLSSVRVDNKKLGELQLNLIRSHAVGVGAVLEDRYVRAMLLLRAATLCHGVSGVSLELVERIVDLLNHGICPVIPEQGSVGASGDLAPLSHLALVLVGEGRARVKGREISGGDALKGAGLKPVVLGPKEGLALINGTQFMAGIGALTCLDAEALADAADVAGALTIEATRGTSAAFEAEIHAVRAFVGQVRVAKRMRGLLANGRSEITHSHDDCGKVQDPYSLRCIPQVHGATRDALAYVRGVIEREANSVTDNPLLFAGSDKVLSGGNFHGQPVALAMDFLAIAVAELGSISERRIDKLVNPAFSELPAFLVKKAGLNSGFMIVQYAAASIVSENKTLCHPASVDSIPTSADKEDHVSMGAWGAIKATRVVQNVRRVLAMEFLAACQGIEFLRPLKTTPILEGVHARIRKISPALDNDRSLHPDIESVTDWLRSGELARLAKA